MEKNKKIGIAVALIVVIAAGVGGGIGAFIVLNQPTTDEEPALSITDNVLEFSFTMSELKSSKYQQVTDKQLFFEAWEGLENGTYNGVSLRSILETEKMLYSGAINFSFVGGDGWNPAPSRGWLNITKVMQAPYDLCILAYGGDDFESDDGPLMPVLNQTLMPEGVRGTGYQVKNTTKVLFHGSKDNAYTPLKGSDVALTIHSEILQFHLTMSELKSSKYQQVTDKQLFFEAWEGLENGTYSGVSLRSILEKEKLLGENALNYSFIGGDGWNPAPSRGWLNITKVMEASYGSGILAYGGEDFEEGDGPLMPVLNQTLILEGVRGTGYQVKNTTEVVFV